jgi:hypothetical protein
MFTRSNDDERRSLQTAFKRKESSNQAFEESLRVDVSAPMQMKEKRGKSLEWRQQ